MINPPKDYKIVKYSEWGGRFLPKTSKFWTFLSYVPEKMGWQALAPREGQVRYLNKEVVVAIPNNHIPRSKIREQNIIKKLWGELTKGLPAGYFG